MSFLAYGILQLGFGLLSLSLKKHYRSIFQKSATEQQIRFYKTAGLCLVAVSGLIYWQQYGLGLGLVWWFTMMCPATLIPAMIFSKKHGPAAKPN